MSTACGTTRRETICRCAAPAVGPRDLGLPQLCSAALVHRVASENILGEIDANVQNAHDIPSSGAVTRDTRQHLAHWRASLELYLYLTLPEWTFAWTNGGRIPIKLASSYLSNERRETQTPDETFIYDVGVDPRTIALNGLPDNFSNCIFIGMQGPLSLLAGSRYQEDGLILSFCTERSWLIARKLGKKSCVRILALDKLKNEIDAQLGLPAITGKCEYTHTYDRHHFLKSTADSWQCEYRMFWPLRANTEVVLPPGTAEVIRLR